MVTIVADRRADRYATQVYPAQQFAACRKSASGSMPGNVATNSVSAGG